MTWSTDHTPLWLLGRTIVAVNRAEDTVLSLDFADGSSALLHADKDGELHLDVNLEPAQAPPWLDELHARRRRQ